MINSTVVKLVTQALETNDVGDSIPTDTERTVYAEMSSIGLKRKIEAEQVGLKLAYVFTLSNVAEYKDEEILIYEGKRYNIVNAYATKEGKIDLTTSRF